MRELEIGEHILIEDHRSAVVWHGRVSRAGGNLVVVTDDQAPPVGLKPNLPVRVCFSDQRWLTKVRGRVLEREHHTVKILLVGQGERVQRRGHIRAPVSQLAHVTVTHADSEQRVLNAEMVDVSEGGCQLRTEAVFSRGDLLQIECCLDGMTVRMVGEVVRAYRDADSCIVGIRATSMSTGARGVISHFVITRSLATGRAEPFSSRRRTTAH